MGIGGSDRGASHAAYLAVPVMDTEFIA